MLHGCCSGSRGDCKGISSLRGKWKPSQSHAQMEQSQGFWQELLHHQQKPLLHMIGMHQGSAALEFMGMCVLQSQWESLKNREEPQNPGF